MSSLGCCGWFLGWLSSHLFYLTLLLHWSVYGLSLTRKLLQRFHEDCSWDGGIRILYDGMRGFDDLIDMVAENALGITDKAFQAECRPLLKKWVKKKHKELINNKKSPFRNNLTTCTHLFS